jgi:hypothetical protein
MCTTRKQSRIGTCMRTSFSGGGRHVSQTLQRVSLTGFRYETWTPPPIRVAAREKSAKLRTAARRPPRRCPARSKTFAPPLRRRRAALRRSGGALARVKRGRSGADSFGRTFSFAAEMNTSRILHARNGGLSPILRLRRSVARLLRLCSTFPKVASQSPPDGGTTALKPSFHATS